MLIEFFKEHISYNNRKQLANTRNKMNSWFNKVIDVLLIPFISPAILILKYYRNNSLNNFPLSKKVLLRIGVFPIIDHYYEPLFNKKHLRYSLRKDRKLPGIDFNDNEQLKILDCFNYNDELLKIPINKRSDNLEYYYNCGIFTYGDAEYLYNIIRHFKPKKIIEIGSGYSTLMAKNATKKNKEELVNYDCEQICIEPFQHEWVKDAGADLIKKNVENIEHIFFKSLKENDILFIDSTHIIRPQGDVLYEYLEILPTLNKGVIIHIHDIFTPKDYPDTWVGENFWNEQYLLEAFLSCNKDFRILGAANYLSHKYHDFFSSKCPMYKNHPEAEPGSFWIIRN